MAKEKRSKFKISANSKRVMFWIDQQGFTIKVEHDEEKKPLEHNRWYAKQLRIALTRLARFGNVK